MDCREFRNLHLAYADNALSDAELVAMEAHLSECERCARYDTVMRRGLLVLRNLPTVEPSADFRDRLNAKLQRINQADARAALYRGPGVGSFVTVAAGMLMAGFLVAMALSGSGAPKVLRMAPVLAMRPAVQPPVVSSDFFASASAGLPVWPAAMMAEQAPVHFADAELQLASFGR
jgi:hypothetical protein